MRKFRDTAEIRFYVTIHGAAPILPAPAFLLFRLSRRFPQPVKSNIRFYGYRILYFFHRLFISILRKRG